MINWLLFYGLTVIGAYVIGSIPSGFVVARLCGIADIRCHGSGNIGATNVARVLGKKFFALVLLLDAGKAYGFLAFLAFLSAPQELLCLSALALLLGNSASLFLRFSGGKGVATTVGCFLYLTPIIVLYALVVWLIVLVLTRIVGAASIAAALCAVFMGVSMFYKQNDPLALTSVVMALWVILLHKKNIQQLLTK